jgi:hypothetical protein
MRSLRGDRRVRVHGAHLGDQRTLHRRGSLDRVLERLNALVEVGVGGAVGLKLGKRLIEERLELGGELLIERRLALLDDSIEKARLRYLLRDGWTARARWPAAPPPTRAGTRRDRR